MDPESVKAVATATGEVAKTSGKIVDAATKLGGFVGDLIVEPLREVAGMWTDSLRARRTENYIDLQVRVKSKLEALGPNARLRQVPMRVGVPLLEAATIEEEPDLRDVWATMLANFANTSSGVSVQKSFVSVLAELSPLEVAIVNTMYAFDRDHPQSGAMWTDGLPDAVVLRTRETAMQIASNPPTLRPEIRLALSNLLRLGVFSRMAMTGGAEGLHAVGRTDFGRELFRACTAPETESR